MKNIDIRSTHNISITFELASVGTRIVAYILDSIFAAIGFSILSSITFGNSTLLGLLMIPTIVLYHFLFEIFNSGQTPGKKIMGIKVISIRGGMPTIEDSLLRWVFRLVDVTGSMGIIGITNIITNNHRQRIGDQLGQTIVITQQSNTAFSDAIIDRKSTNNTSLSSKLKSFNDDQFLLIKKTIARYQNHQTLENRDFLKQLALHLSDELGLEITNSDYLTFLQNLLKDYIQSTR